MDSKHTKGPWLIAIDDVVEKTCEVFVRVPGNEYQTICEVRLTGDALMSDEAEANAKLISAAPELLEALKELHSECVNAALRAGTKWPLSAPSQLKLDEKCRAAIAKATL